MSNKIRLTKRILYDIISVSQKIRERIILTENSRRSAVRIWERAEESPIKKLTGCPVGDIRAGGMILPGPEKFRYYENYFLETRRFSHGIIVDEDKKLRDGYVTYLLALKYGAAPDIFEVPSGQLFRKVIKCRFVRYRNRRWEAVDGKLYVWAYESGGTVAPGDVLRPAGQSLKYALIADEK